MASSMKRFLATLQEGGTRSLVRLKKSLLASAGVTLVRTWPPESLASPLGTYKESNPYSQISTSQSERCPIVQGSTSKVQGGPGLILAKFLNKARGQPGF